MDFTIVTTEWTRSLLGITITHDPEKSYGEEIMRLLDDVFKVVNANSIANSGLSFTVYLPEGRMFVGIEPTEELVDVSTLEKLDVSIPKYAYWKHVGPYSMLPQVFKELTESIVNSGNTYGKCAVEMYGHWNDDESKLETDIMFGLA